MSTSNTRLVTIAGRVLPSSKGAQGSLLSKQTEQLVESIRARQCEELWLAAFTPRERAAIRARGPRAESTEERGFEPFAQANK